METSSSLVNFSIASEGVLSNKVGVNYKEKILRPGGTKPAQELVEEFLGRPWDDNSFLLQRNLI